MPRSTSLIYERSMLARGSHLLLCKASLFPGQQEDLTDNVGRCGSSRGDDGVQTYGQALSGYVGL